MIYTSTVTLTKGNYCDTHHQIHVRFYIRNKFCTQTLLDFMIAIGFCFLVMPPDLIHVRYFALLICIVLDGLMVNTLYNDHVCPKLSLTLK